MFSLKFIACKQIPWFFMMVGLGIVNSAVMAQGDSDTYILYLNFECPTTSPVGTDTHFIVNMGGEISGPGFEYANGRRIGDAHFVGSSFSGIPLDLKSYHRESTAYDPNLGVVYCNYASSTGFPAFTVNYPISKGDGGNIYYTTAKSITIRYLFGLKKGIA